VNAKVLMRQLRFEAPAAGLAMDAPIPATIATSSPVMRYGVAEVLDCSATGVDLARAPLPLIIGHDSSKLSIGLVENLKAQGDRVTGDVRFATSPEAQQVRADVVAGIHRSLSVGYALIGEGTPVNGGFMYQWQPHEVSIVPIPADPLAGFFRSLSESQTMPATNTENRDAAAITALCARHSMPTLANTYIRDGKTLDQVGRLILEELATRDMAYGGHINVSSSRGGDAGGVAERELLVNTLVQRMGGKPTGEVIRATDCTGIAMRALQLGGHNVSNRDSRDHILHRAMGTSDFPTLLGNAAGRVLLAAFDEAPAVLKQVARLNNLPNFKDRTVLRLPGGAPSLEKVNEHGEFKHGAMAEEANAWRLYTYGRIVSLSRQALVNDDLSAFAGMLTEFGRAAARRESDELVSMLIGTPLVDDVALFHADRSSLITTALGATGLSNAVKALRLQKETGGGFIIQEPAYLVVPAALERLARQNAAAITPTESANVQPYNVKVIVEPRLDAISVDAWYLVSDNQLALEYGYLDGEQGPQIFQEEGFSVDALSIKCRLDFGSGWVAPCGWVKSTGAVPG
jgi:hypothetical protein